MEVYYVDRKTGKKEKEKIYGVEALQFFYGDSWLSKVFGSLLMHLTARIPWFSQLAGYVHKRAGSRARIDPFIEEYGMDRDEFLEDSFASFNDFFIRKLKSECRPIVKGPDRLAAPADGRYFIFPDLSQLDHFYVKGQKFDLKRFLQDPILARRYEDGALVLVRLCPIDYHRFHFPCEGIASMSKEIKGPLYSVNPIALRKKLGILWENKRMVAEIETQRFGHILYVEIGATCVGSIHQTYVPEGPVKKGEEKGYFSFGGSCIALLFERGKVLFDEDFVHNSAQGLETLARYGESLGRWQH
jgi:phosphatidylserine decarboxylase